MSLFLQILGTSAGILGALLTVYKKRGCWIAFMVSNISFVCLFLLLTAYVPILQYLVFIPLNVLGWIKWGRNEKHRIIQADKT